MLRPEIKTNEKLELFFDFSLVTHECFVCTTFCVFIEGFICLVGFIFCAQPVTSGMASLRESMLTVYRISYKKLCVCTV